MAMIASDEMFGGDYSQARATSRASWPATLQWHGGNSRSARDDFESRGGFFLPEEGIRNLGLDPANPPPGATLDTLKFETKRENGWGFAQIHLAVLQTAFGWEDRDTRQRFPRDEYRRRREVQDGSEAKLRGRLYVMAVARELNELGVADPVLVTLRGTYSRALDSLVRDRLGAIAATATKLRQRRGLEGAVPREAFWLPVTPASPARVGSGANTSEVALPTSPLPEVLPPDDEAFRALVRPLLVPSDYARAGGHFDTLCAEYRPLWETLAAFASAPGVQEPVGDDEQATAREECLRQASISHPDLTDADCDALIVTVFTRNGIDPAAATAADYRRMTEWLRRKAAPAGVR
jgi:hypothetical protein